ncbi:MAG: hypothetical protein IKR48_06250 [Kiritimatiellae bacterium]|nr:hypothetical protein [Kiritimatiellia bacterium]
MSDESLIEKVAVLAGIRPAQLKLSDVHKKIPDIRRMVEKHKKAAITAEAESLKKRELSFAAETKPAERASLFRKADADMQRAKMEAGFASNFLTQLGYYTLLETTMQIVEQMKENGLVDEKTSTVDWQKSIDSMQDEIQEMLAVVKKLGDAMGAALACEEPESHASLANELDQLYAKFDAEPDPVKKAEIRKQIEAKAVLA